MKLLIEHCGGCTKFARRFGMPLRTVQNWYYGTSQPPEWLVKNIIEAHVERVSERDKLIEQMREALKTADILIDELVETHVERCASVYDDDRNEIKAALSAAERERK